MLIFAQPQYLILIFLVPVFLVLYGFKRYRRKKSLKKLGDEQLVRQLMPSYSSLTLQVETK